MTFLTSAAGRESKEEIKQETAHRQPGSGLKQAATVCGERGQDRDQADGRDVGNGAAAVVQAGPLGEDRLGEDRLVIRFWNVGGIQRNFPSIRESVCDCDVIVLVETFLSEEGLSNFQFPPGYLVFSNPALRYPRVDRRIKGRSAGGIVLLARSSLFVPKECKSKCIGPSILSCSLTLISGGLLNVIGVYWVESDRSPVYDSNFSELLTSLCVSQGGSEEVLLVGDFNSKIGDCSTDLGRVEEFAFLLPDESANKSVNEHGRFLIESLCSGV